MVSDRQCVEALEWLCPQEKATLHALHYDNIWKVAKNDDDVLFSFLEALHPFCPPWVP